jgi:hypothetical protein
MKKVLLIAAICVILVAVAGVFAFREISTTSIVAAEENHTVSAKSAKSLQDKIDAIKHARDNANRAPGASRVEISEIELESYMLFSLKSQIPAQMDSFDAQLQPGTVGAQTQLTFSSDATGNPIIDAVVAGTHDLFVKGSLAGKDGRGKFELLEVRVDGIPMPKVLILSLFDKYVKPKYPEADLKEPFDLPWGIEELALEQGKVTVAY